MYLYAGSARARGVGDCTCLLPTLNDLGETSGPRIDRIQPVRPPWWRRQYRELKKLIFSAPSKCPIDLFGPYANGTILKRLVVLLASALHAARSDLGPEPRPAISLPAGLKEWHSYALVVSHNRRIHSATPGDAQQTQLRL